MKITYLNDTEKSQVLYKNTLNIEDRVKVLKPTEGIEFELTVEENKGLFIKTWEGLVLISTKDL